MIKTCAVCGKPFSTIYSQQKYCSETCSKQAKQAAVRKALEKRYCLTCGHIFYTRPLSDKKFCCRTCQMHYNPENKNKKTLTDWAVEARACRMTYGKYRAAVERFGKTFEELKGGISNEN